LFDEIRSLTPNHVVILKNKAGMSVNLDLGVEPAQKFEELPSPVVVDPELEVS
jgi:hypothetical protein